VIYLPIVLHLAEDLELALLDASERHGGIEFDAGAVVMRRQPTVASYLLIS
jgi:hypothetical protein